MITRQVAIEIKSIGEAPNYNKEPNNDFKPMKIEKMIVVKDGMQSGNPSIDIQCVDAEGNKYLLFVTGNIFRSMAIAANAHYKDGGASLV